MSGIRKLSELRQKDTGTSPKTFSEEVWLVKSLENSLGGPQRKNRAGVFYPSMLGSYCMRLLYLAYNGLLKAAGLLFSKNKWPAHANGYTTKGIIGIKYHQPLYNTSIVNIIVTTCPIKCNNLVFVF